MKKHIIVLLVSIGFIPLSFAVEINCPGGWQSVNTCNQCFQVFLSEPDLAFSSSDIFFSRANLASNQKENVWLDDSAITGYALQGANIGPSGNLKNLYEYPHDAGTHANGKRYTSVGFGESKTWARMKAGSGIGIHNVPGNIDPDLPVYRIEYRTASEIEEANGSIKPSSLRYHTECVFYTYAMESAQASIEIIKDDNDNNDDYQKVIMTTGGGSISGEASVGAGLATFWIEVRNTGGVTLRDVYVDDPRAPNCNRTIGTLRPGETFDYTCTDNRVTASYTNTAIVHGKTERGEIVTDQDDTYVDVTTSGMCRISVAPPAGNTPLTSEITCEYLNETNMRIIIGQSGITQRQYDSSRARHTFEKPGVYDVVCVSQNTPNISCRTNVYVTKLCGNGIVEEGEQCDDGNTRSGDGCNSTCQIEKKVKIPDTGPEDIIFGVLMMSIFGAGGWMYYRRRGLG